jgi:hypothetical protein
VLSAVSGGCLATKPAQGVINWRLEVGRGEARAALLSGRPSITADRELRSLRFVHQASNAVAQVR